MDKIQLISILVSLILIVFIFLLIMYRRLKEEYSLLWLFFSFLFLALSIWKDGLEWIAGLLGISYAPAALFLILIMSIFVMLVEFSIIISKQSEWIKQSAQEIGLLKLEMENYKNKLEDAVRKESLPKKLNQAQKTSMTDDENQI